VATEYRALATDYDGTLAHDSHVTRETLVALQRLKDSGRHLILVTGREMPQLESVFPEYRICDAVVAENGGLVVWPAENREEVLSQPIPEAFVQAAVRREIQPFSIGRVVFATWRPFESVVLEIIHELGLEYQIIFNKRAVMVLPSGVNKATGLAHVLAKLNVSASQVVGIGDAENDHAFLNSCGRAVAVANALQSLKAQCDWVTTQDHGDGVSALIERLLADDLRSLGATRPRPATSPTMALPS
jgi:hydroxymethylpyrimidine pyrophosphatase-like HAD family hydrolase